MIQTIIIAKRYKKTPSEMLKIDYDYLAYMIDEVALHIEDKLTDKQGKTKWENYPISKNNNNEMLEHARKVNKRN